MFGSSHKIFAECCKVTLESHHKVYAFNVKQFKAGKILDNLLSYPKTFQLFYYHFILSALN